MLADTWRSRLPELIRFSAAGLAAFGCDLGVLVVLRSSTTLPLALDAVLAFLVASLVNFVLARQWVFEEASQGLNPTADLVRFGLLTLVGLVLTAVLVPGFALLMDYRAAKLLASGVGALLNLLVLPRWVFTSPRC